MLLSSKICDTISTSQERKGIKMTIKERQSIQKFINKIQSYREDMSTTLEILKDLNEAFGDGDRYCSWKNNLDGVLMGKCSQTTKRRAQSVYESYVSAKAKYDLQIGRAHV